jgi:hypothetical protein
MMAFQIVQMLDRGNLVSYTLAAKKEAKRTLRFISLSGSHSVKAPYGDRLTQATLREEKQAEGDEKLKTAESTLGT